jgi:DNA-binding NarL/FixJ family response regulator
VRVVIGEDQVLLRQGVVRLLEDAGFDVVAEAGDAPDLLRKVRAHKPDVAIVDVQMPPDNTDDGLRAALEIRARQPEVGVLVLSQFAGERYALDLIGDSAEGVGYLLKDRVADFTMFAMPSGASAPAAPPSIRRSSRECLAGAAARPAG